MNKITLSIVIILCLSGIYFFSRNKTQNKNSTLVVGTVGDYAPWVSVNAQGEYEGFDVDVIKAVAQHMNKDLVIKDLGSMPSLFIALKQGKVDAIIWGISITQDRLKKVAMIRYQGDKTTSYPLIFWQKIPSDIKSINDMTNKTICIEPASSQDMVLSRYPFINKKPTEKVDDGLLNIQYGKADAAFVEPAIAKKFKNKYPQIKTLDVPLMLEDQVNGVGICIKKENKPLINQVKEIVNTLIKDGTIKTLQTKWDIS